MEPKARVSCDEDGTYWLHVDDGGCDDFSAPITAEFAAEIAAVEARGERLPVQIDSTAVTPGDVR